MLTIEQVDRSPSARQMSVNTQQNVLRIRRVVEGSGPLEERLKAINAMAALYVWAQVTTEVQARGDMMGEREPSKLSKIIVTESALAIARKAKLAVVLLHLNADSAYDELIKAGGRVEAKGKEAQDMAKT